MFTILVESRASRTRHPRGAATSIALHAALVTGAIIITGTKSVVATTTPPPRYTVLYRAPLVSRPVTPPASSATPHQAAAPSLPRPVDVVIPPPAAIGATIHPVDIAIHAAPPTRSPAHAAASTGASSPFGLDGGVSRAGDPIDASVSGPCPRVLGAPPAPRYPEVLRASGVAGRVVVRFVVDTLGRAELADVSVLESGHALLSAAVMEALPRFRFAPGEVAGRRVRTMVQMPFVFELGGGGRDESATRADDPNDVGVKR